MRWTGRDQPEVDPGAVCQVDAVKACAPYGAQSVSSFRIEYQLVTTVTTQPAIPAKNRTSKPRMIPISMCVSMKQQGYTLGVTLVQIYCIMLSESGHADGFLPDPIQMACTDHRVGCGRDRGWYRPTDRGAGEAKEA
jgi:hypothetical protein